MEPSEKPNGVAAVRHLLLASTAYQAVVEGTITAVSADIDSGRAKGHELAWARFLTALYVVERDLQSLSGPMRVLLGEAGE